MKKEIESQKRGTEVDLEKNDVWLRNMVRTKRHGEDFTRLRQPYELIHLVTSKDLQEVANKYLDLAKIVQITPYPETNEVIPQADLLKEK